MQREVHDSVPERETRVPQMRVSASKRETRILLAPKCETNVLPVLERNSRIFYTKREVRDLKQTQPMLGSLFNTTWGSRFWTETQSPCSVLQRQRCKAKSPHSHGFEASSSDTPVTDLRDFLTRKRSVHKSLLDVIASGSSQQCFLIAIAYIR